MSDASSASLGQSLTYTAPDLLRRRWKTRRLKIQRQWLGLKPKTIVDCSLDACVVVGTIEYQNDGHASYGVYVDLESGRRHAIPHGDHSLEAANRTAKEVSAAIGLPRLDITYP